MDSSQQSNGAERGEQEQIIAALCADAPNVDVRNCLRKYSPDKNTWQIEAAFKQDRKNLLVETLAYLGVPGMGDYKADALPHELVCRIQNLLPDICHLCKKSYCVKLADRPIVSCVRCGQGCHNECLLTLLGITEEGLNEDNNYGLDIVNPNASVGLYYLCGYCSTDVIPQKDALKVKSKVKKSQTAASDQPSDNNITPTTQPQDEDTDVDGGVEEGESQNNQDPSSQTNASGQNNTGIQPVRQRPRVPLQQPARTDESVPEPSICKFYRLGRCRHGISGKKDGTCIHRHPKPCQKFLTNGDRRQRGCTLGKRCQDFHPQMCTTSLRERLCHRENCKFMHVKGTKRAERNSDQGAPLYNSNVEASPTQRIDKRRAPSNNNQATPKVDETFLGQIKSLGDHMQLITKRLERMDFNYSLVLQQQAMLATPATRAFMQPHCSPLPQYPQQQQGGNYLQTQLLQGGPYALQTNN